MPDSEPENHPINRDPVVAFATDAEIALADRLRYRIEQRFLARPMRNDAGPIEPSEA